MPAPVQIPLKDAHSHHARHISSKNATKTDFLSSSPTLIIASGESPVASSPSSTIIAETIALARDHLDHSNTEELLNFDDDLSDDSQISNVAEDYVFGFDIDGVLIRGGHVIPEAKEALRLLNGENEEGIKVPYIFLTNGGGKTEQERCLDLTKQLDVAVSPEQFICGHTPMSEMATQYETVLVVGGEGEKCRHVAENYGFKDVITPGDLIKWKPSVCPFRKLTDEEYTNSRTRDFTNMNIEAIFVFADSRDWASDAQIILELLMSKEGRMSTVSETFDEGPPIFFAHNDVVWSTAYDLTRYGMGALRIMIEALYKESTGKSIDVTSYGKPSKATFDYATRVLQQWRKDLFSDPAPPQTVYFVGDTPESDIRGSNEYDKHSESDWFSILVETGVYEPGTEPRYKPKKTVANVLEAVKFGMERERRKRIQRGISLGSIGK
ncbi:hypothetical protein H072_2807 [Dactylellina haptotyla CBS 200.50]|uniref:Uncharacterized protein n=1 Tax=Dactylellina haptotyla (strain CBS 200.50) TaxID=1284197 RepID=S8BUP6_DACHA|nr:hypothetical protein H072_2807 [Dactylellina haptotyla CBS 200.50]